MTQTEVRSRHGDSHLGHSSRRAARQGRVEILHELGLLRFIHRDQSESEGYGEYAKLFAKQDA